LGLKRSGQQGRFELLFLIIPRSPHQTSSVPHLSPCVSGNSLKYRNVVTASSHSDDPAQNGSCDVRLSLVEVFQSSTVVNPIYRFSGGLLLVLSGAKHCGRTEHLFSEPQRQQQKPFHSAEEASAFHITLSPEQKAGQPIGFRSANPEEDTF
jgi:hypothetical protein